MSRRLIMALKDRRHRVLMQYLIAFLVSVSIPVLVLGIVFYDNASSILRKELEGHIEGEMRRLSDVFDGMIGDLYQTGFKASYDPALSWYNVERNDYSRWSIIQRLSSYRREYVDAILLSFFEEDVVFTDAGSMALGKLAKSVFFLQDAEHNAAYQRFIGLLNDADRPQLVPIGESRAGSGNPSSYLTYTYPLRTKEPFGAISFVLSSSTLQRLVTDILGSLNGAILVLDGRGDLLFIDRECLSLPDSAVSSLLHPNRPSGTSSVQMGGRKLSLVDVTSSRTGLRYVAVLSLAEYAQRVLQVKRYVLLSILFVLLVSSVAGIAMALRIYRPIRNLRDRVRVTCEGTAVDQNNDELTYISSVLSETLDANEHLNERLVRQLTIVQELVLLKILKGQVTRRADAQTMLSTNDIAFRGAFVGVAVMSIDDEGPDGMDVDSLIPVLKGALESVESGRDSYCVGLDRRQAALIVTTSHEDTEHRVMAAIADTCRTSLKRVLPGEVHVGVGRFYRDFMRMNRSLLEALAAHEHRVLKERVNTMFYTDISFDRRAAHWYPSEQQDVLRQCLRQGNISAYRAVMREILSAVKVKMPPVESLRCICFDIINDTVKFLNEYHIVLREDCIRELGRFTSMEDLRRKLDRVAVQICSYVAKADRTESSRISYLRSAVLEYLCAHYGNSQLNLDMVADALGISAKHLSAIFRHLTECNFGDYLRKLRINHAKRLLADGHRTVSQIGRDAGFSNPARFIRSFKAIEGVTPGQFRAILHLHDAVAPAVEGLEK